MSVEKFRPTFGEGTIKHEVKPYSMMLNKPFQDCENLEAIGLWAHFQTLPEDWIISPTYIKNKFNMSKNKVYDLLNTLIELNLLRRERLINIDGTFGKTTYIIRNGEEYISKDKRNYPLPKIQEVDKNPLPLFPDMDNPDLDNEDTTNKNKNTNASNKQNKQKSFCEKAQKMNNKGENEKKHEFAESMDQMACETRNIKKHEEIKRIEMGMSNRVDTAAYLEFKQKLTMLKRAARY